MNRQLLIVAKSVTVSVLISTAALTAAPFLAFILLQAGIAGLPYWNDILKGLILTAIILPGLASNVYLTYRELIIYRIVAITLYLLVFLVIANATQRFIINALQDIGQF